MHKYAIVIACCLMLAGCGQKVVLMEDLDGSVGTVVVTARTGETVTLNQANQVVSGKDDVSVMSEKEVQSTFAEVLAAQPEPTVRFLMYFKRDSATLTSASGKLFPEIMRAYRDRQSRDVSVIGHTDTVGDTDYNYRLSLRRAEKVVEILVQKGMDPNSIQTMSHGEENPLVPTPDGKAEPKNRRVEVLIR